MTRVQLSRVEVADLARVERYLILSLIVVIPLGILAVALSTMTDSGAVLTLFTLLRSVIGLASLALYFFLLRLARVPGGWAYVAAALLLSFFAPLLTWLLIGYHIFQVNRYIFRPRGIAVGLLGPRL